MGLGTLGTLQVVKKIDLDKLGAALAPYFSGCHALTDVELARDEGLELTTEDERLIRIFARNIGGSRCVVKALDGGLSASKVQGLRCKSTWCDTRPLCSETRQHRQRARRITPLSPIRSTVGAWRNTAPTACSELWGQGDRWCLLRPCARSRPSRSLPSWLRLIRQESVWQLTGQQTAFQNGTTPPLKGNIVFQTSAGGC